MNFKTMKVGDTFLYTYQDVTSFPQTALACVHLSIFQGQTEVVVPPSLTLEGIKEKSTTLKIKTTTLAAFNNRAKIININPYPLEDISPVKEQGIYPFFSNPYDPLLYGKVQILTGPSCPYDNNILYVKAINYDKKDKYPHNVEQVIIPVSGARNVVDAWMFAAISLSSFINRRIAWTDWWTWDAVSFIRDAKQWKLYIDDTEIGVSADELFRMMDAVKVWGKATTVAPSFIKDSVTRSLSMLRVTEASTQKTASPKTMIHKSIEYKKSIST